MVEKARRVPGERERAPHMPPRWFVRSFWAAHRALYRTSGGRVGLRRPTPTRWGMLRLRTIGRRTAEERSAILGYFEDGPNLVTLAMNGWAEGEPAWWLNLQAYPDSVVDLVDGPRTVRARAAVGDERDRLWARWRDVGDDVDAYAPLRSSETAVVILEPADGSQTDTAAGTASGTGETKMHADRRIAIVAGMLFIIATVADLISRLVFVTPILSDPVDLSKVSANESQVLLGALFLFIGAAAAAGIALALYPVLRTHGEGLALGSVGFRLIEGVLYLGIVVCLLSLATLSQESAKAGAAASSAFQAQAALLMAARDSLGEVAVLAFGLGALMYYWVFYQSRLVPRWLSAWGLAAIALLMTSGVLVMLGVTEPMSTTQVVLALPIFLQEMVLAVWLIAKGFNRSGIAAEPAGRTPVPRAAATGSAA